jgi:carboxyl-terminal processing protease
MIEKFRGPVAFLSLLIFFIVGYLIGGGYLNAATGSPGDVYKNLDLFARVLSLVKENYVEEPDDKSLIYGAIKGMLNSLDPHSSFMDPDFFREMEIETKGSFGGLGIEITIKDSILTVVAPIEGTPADKAGMKAGDQVIRIDGKSTKGITLMEAVKKLRGKPGTKVTLSIMRENLDRLWEVTIVRSEIKLKSVRYEILEPGYGYIRINSFQERTGSDFRETLNKLESEEEMAGLILDMRNNPGGLLDSAVEVADEFIDSGIIVKTDVRKATMDSKYTAKKGKKHGSYPMIVLINEGSASASEIVAGALQDHHRAIILGKKSFGKGTVQSILPLGDGSALKLTTAKYYTPSGRSIQATGIVPDIDVDQKLVLNKTTPAKRYLEKDLEGHFEPEGAPEKLQTPAEEGEEESPETLPQVEVEDTQLQRALDLLKGWKILLESQPEMQLSGAEATSGN